MNKIFERVFLHHKTSIPGVLLIIFGFVALWFGKLELFGLLTCEFIGCFLLSADDKIIEKITFGLLKIEDKYDGENNNN